MKSKDTVLKVTVGQIFDTISLLINEDKDVANCLDHLIEYNRQNHIDWEKVRKLKESEKNDT